MPLPSDGAISLLGYSRPGETSQSRPKQAMIVRMSEKTLDLLESFPQLQFEFSDNPGITIGDTFFSVTSVQETAPHDLYLRTSLAGKKNAPLKLYANVTGKFTVERQLDDRITDKVRASTVDAQKERAGRGAIFLETATDLPPPNGKKRKEGNTTSIFRKPVRPTDHPHRPPPSITATTPSGGASPAPALSQRSKEALQSLRKRMISCIALSERTSDQIVRLVGGSSSSEATKRDILELLREIAEPVPMPNGSKAPKNYRLTTKSWLEVRPYEPSTLTESERTILARGAKLALRVLKVPESDSAWSHVQYRNQNDNKVTQTSDPPKRGISSTTAKEKKAPKPRDNGEVMMKNESIKASNSRPSTSHALRDDDARPLPPKPSANRPRPGSGFKIKQPTPTESRDLASGRSPIIHGKAIPEPPNGTHDKGSHHSQASSSSHAVERRPGATSARKVEKLRREDVAASDSERSDRTRDRERERANKIKDREREARERERERKERESEREKERERDRRELERQRERERAKRREAEQESDRERERERARKKVRERGRSREREDGERSDDSLRPPKRPKVSREDDEYTMSSSRPAPKKRKADPPPLRDAKSRDLSLPKKPEQESHPRPKAIKREASPAPRLKETSPPNHIPKVKEPSLPPIPRIKKEPTPINKLSAPIAKPSPSVSSSQASNSKSKPSVRRRRGSDIYTSSSEDEGEIRPSVKHEPPHLTTIPATPNHHDKDFPQPRPRTSKLPHTDDHDALRTHYSASYIPYLGNFQSLLKQKEMLRNMLQKIERGSSGSVTESDGDGEMLDGDELKRLVSEYHNQHEDLENIQRIFSKKN